MARILGLAMLAALVPLAAHAQQQGRAAQTPTQAPAWVYGEHPLWGLSAHITVDAHSVGLRCLTPKGEGPVLALAYTPDLVQKGPDGPSINYKLVGTDGLGSYGVDPKGSYFEGAGSACDVGLEGFQKAKTLVLDDGAKKPKVLGRIPLTGAKAAIAKLIAACPPIRRGLENCGL